jgi:hypothetical protein
MPIKSKEKKITHARAPKFAVFEEKWQALATSKSDACIICKGIYQSTIIPALGELQELLVLECNKT